MASPSNQISSYAVGAFIPLRIYFNSLYQYLIAEGIPIIKGNSGPKIIFCNPCPHSCAFTLSSLRQSSQQMKKHPSSRPPQFLPIVVNNLP